MMPWWFWVLSAMCFGLAGWGAWLEAHTPSDYIAGQWDD